MFAYDAKKRKPKAVQRFQKLVDEYENVTPQLLEVFFSSLQLAEVVECFFDAIRPKMDEDAVVFGIPIRMDALDIAQFFNVAELSEIVAQIALRLKNATENEETKQLA